MLRKFFGAGARAGSSWKRQSSGQGAELDYLELNVLEENKNGIRFYLREKFKAVSQTMRYRL
jgi:hypothetical protein